MASIARVVARFKADVGRVLSPAAIERACRDLGHEHRRRVLDPASTVHAFLTQVLHGNVACSALPHLTGKDFSVPAYVNARARLPLELVEGLFERTAEQLGADDDPDRRWCGHRVWLVDGSSFSMPDRPELQEAFGQPGNQKPGCGFPVAHVLALFDAGTGFLRRIIPSPLRTHDQANALDLPTDLGEGDLLVADRGFASYAHLATISRRNRHALFRCHQKQIVNFRPHRRHRTSSRDPAGLPTSRWLRRLGPRDQLVEYARPAARPDGMSPEDFAALPETLVVRELRCRIENDGGRTREVTVVTTLVDPDRYTAEALAALYGRRWQVELNLRHLKTTMRMEALHCQSVEGVLKELAIFALVYNLVRVVVREAARRQRVPVDRISFIDAWRWLQCAAPETPLPDLIINPRRPGRQQPRVLKRRKKQYPLMTKARSKYRKSPGKSRDAA